MKFLKILAAICLVGSWTSANAVEREGLPYPDDNQIQGKYYLIVTPPAGLTQIKSGNSNDLSAWEREIIDSVADASSEKTGESPKLLPARGWKNDLKFEVAARETVIEGIATDLRTAFSSQKSGRITSNSRVRIDEIMHPMKDILLPSETKAGVKQWMYDSAQKYPGATNVREAWKWTKNMSLGDGVVVAVIDTGTIPHADLLTNTLSGYDFISPPAIGNDGNGRDAFPTDEGDFFTHDGRFFPSSWHGTHVQGTIAASINREKGYTGIAPRAKIYPIRVLGTGGGISSDIQDAIVYASGGEINGLPINRRPADIINLSLGSAGTSLCSTSYQEAFDFAASRGVTVIVAAGNSGSDSTLYSPGSCKNIITVAANTREGRLANYSNSGKNITLAAPGGETSRVGFGVMSTISLDQRELSEGIHTAYKEYQGTSMATPVVSGIVALMISHAKRNNVELSVAEIRRILKDTAQTPFPSVNRNPCDTRKCGSGIIDALAALKAVNAMAGGGGKGDDNKDDDKGSDDVRTIKKGKCLSEYSVAEKLFGPEKAGEMFPGKYEYSGDCK